MPSPSDFSNCSNRLDRSDASIPVKEYKRIRIQPNQLSSQVLEVPVLPFHASLSTKVNEPREQHAARIPIQLELRISEHSQRNPIKGSLVESTPSGQ